jgi:V/A-type H+-transporting ATPase subunit I
MSIVPLDRVTFVGLSNEKEQLLDDLHQFGALEIIRLGGANVGVGGGPSSQAREALKFLLAAPQRRRQASDRSRFDAAEVERRALELQSRILALEAERDDMLLRLQAARPFGDFAFASPKQMGDWRLWFYPVPQKEMAKFEAAVDSTGNGGALAWEIAARDPSVFYVVVVSQREPQNVPVPRVRVGSRSPAELKRRLEEVELAIEDAQAERAYLTRWCLLLARSLTALEDAAARGLAAEQTCDRNPLFALQAWVPRERTGELSQYAQQKDFVFECRPPTAEENPPTLVRNVPAVEAGEDLVNFYMTPGYWTWDPSAIVFVSFALFFAMIVADAGYSAVLGVGLLLIWRKLGQPMSDGLQDPNSEEGGEASREHTAGQRFRPMLLLIVVASLVYGAMVGSYFGIVPPPDSLLGRLRVLDMSNSQLMMGLSVLVGGLHLLLANVMDARRCADWRDGLASLGWASVVGGGLLFAAGVAIPAAAVLKQLGGGAMVAGLLLVVGYTARSEKPLKRLVQGLLGLTRVSAAFGDTLSYLRLFALGLASASLATAFNEMAAGIHSGLPRLGLLLALLVLVFGHALNLLLAVSSGVIHGLRLNVIEFFNWGLRDEGRRFTPFRRKEGALWN